MTDNVAEQNELPIISFDLTAEWESWLEENHANSNGIWLMMHKKASGLRSISYKEALDAALCYGWIDSQLKVYSEDSYLQRFTPRRPRSLWSRRNIENVVRLEMEGRMKPSGLREAEVAKAEGRWQKAYDSPGRMNMPDDLLNELVKNKKAAGFFETLNKANKYAIAWRLQTAQKPETRKNRLKSILEMLEKGEKFHD